MENTLSPKRPAHGALPSLFVPHGAPTFALRPGAAGAAMARYAQGLPTPRAIVIVSAHWNTSAPAIGASKRPPTVHDYWGFPAELYRLNYPATGCVEASREVEQALRDAGFPAQVNENQGLDHGAWIPLRLMFPEADVPVIPMSIQFGLGPAHHLAVGRALAPLARRGFLIIGSGNLTHNLRDYMSLQRGQRPDLGYIRAFADWMWDHIPAGDLEALSDYRRVAPGAGQAHPEEDHLLPLFVALGAQAAQGYRAERPHVGVDDYVLAMDFFAFHPAARSTAN